MTSFIHKCVCGCECGCGVFTSHAAPHVPSPLTISNSLFAQDTLTSHPVLYSDVLPLPRYYYL